MNATTATQNATPIGTLQVEAYQSRWGFHAVSYQTFQKIRRLSKLFFLAQHQIAAWRRWYRKAPHNRVIRKAIRNEAGQKVGYELLPILMSEPKVLDGFVDCHVQQSRIDVNGVWHERPVELKTKYLSRLALKVMESRMYASIIKTAPELVPTLPLSVAEIDELYERFKDRL